MPIDPAVYALQRQPSINTPFESLGQVMQLRNQQLANQVGQQRLQQEQFAQQEAQKKAQEDDEFKAAFQNPAFANLSRQDFLKAIQPHSTPQQYEGVLKTFADSDDKAAATKKAIADAQSAQAQAALHLQSYDGHLADQIAQSNGDPVVVHQVLQKRDVDFPLPEFKQQTDALRQIFATQGKAAGLAAVKAYVTAETQKTRGEANTQAAELPGKQAVSAREQQVTAGTVGGITPQEQATNKIAQGHLALERQKEAYAETLAKGDVESAVQGMKEGTIPPQMPGRASKEYVQLLAEAKRQGYNLAAANTDWNATQAHIKTLNGSQQTRLNQSINALPDLLDSVDNLASQWKGGKFPLLNKANLVLAKGGAYGADVAAVANKLDAQIADVTADLGNVYMGGNSPTDQALNLSAKSLNANWDEKVLHSLVDQARQNVRIRQNSIKNTGVAGASATNPYAPQQAAPPPQATGGPKVGDVVTVKGQKIKISAIHPDGSFDGNPVK